MDSSPRAEDLSKTDPSKPIEPNVDKSRSQPEASDASLASDISTITTKDNLNQKEIESDSTKPNSAKPLENNLKEIELNTKDNVEKCEDSTTTFNQQHKDSPLSEDESETTKDTVISRPNSSNLKGKETKENIEEFLVKKTKDENDHKAHVEGEDCTGGVNGENMKKVFDILDDSKSGHIPSFSFGHLVRSIGKLLKMKSIISINTIIFRILSNGFRDR